MGTRRPAQLWIFPKKVANGKKVADFCHNLWKIETAFQNFNEHLNSEINTLAYISAVLFSFV